MKVLFSHLKKYKRDCILAPLFKLCEATLELLIPLIVADIIDRGITLTGGGALLRGLDRLVNEQTGIDVHVAEAPLDCVAAGAGAVLDNIDLLRDVVADASRMV